MHLEMEETTSQFERRHWHLALGKKSNKQTKN